jgi:hypothetical protein
MVTLNQKRRRFNAFLREHNCCSLFHVNAAKQSKIEEDIFPNLDFANATSYYKPIDWVLHAFVWQYTPEGHEFWDIVHKAWKQVRKQENI